MEQDSDEPNAWDSDANDIGEERESLDVGKRLAVMDLDWDNLTAQDIFAIFNSFCKGEMLIEKVSIFPSLYGIQQMKNDSIYGPPKELYNPKKLSEKRMQESSEESAGSEEGEFEVDEELESE